jgi:hypothetical protein
MTLGLFIHFIHEFFWNTKNALNSDFIENFANNNSIFENLISSLKIMLAIIIVFENLISILKNMLAIIIVFENLIVTLKNMLAIIIVFWKVDWNFEN